MTLSVLSRALVFVVALGIGPALAQQSTTQPPQQAGTPGAQIPQSQFAAARDLVVASGMSRSFDATIADLSQQLEATVTRTRPELTSDMAAVMKQLAPEFQGQAETMVNNAARIYASALSEQDLKDLVTFYNSPLGKRYVSFEPLIMTNIDQLLSQWREQVSLGMMDRVHAELKKRGHDF